MSSISVGGTKRNLELRGMPDILLKYPDMLPAPLRDSLFEDIGDIADIVVVKEEPPQMWASLKIAMIGLIVAFIAKPYLEGFATEAGKDHYQTLKRWLS